MTEIRLNRDNDKVQIVADGHAGYSVRGADIVCASISVMIYSLGLYCDRKEKEGLITLDRLDILDGHTDMVIDDAHHITREALDMFIGGIKALEEEYPKNLHVTMWGEIEN